MLFPVSARADSKTFEPSRDTYVDSEVPNGSYGSIGLGAVGYYTSGPYSKFALFHFDTSSIPAGSVIESAKLTVRVGGCTGSGASYERIAAGAYISNGSPGWTESSTYQQLSTNGSSLGGGGPQIVPCSPGSYTDLNVIELVDAWVNRSFSNDGLYLGPVSGVSNWTRVMYMREATASSRPKLTVNYSVPFESVDTPDGGLPDTSSPSASSNTVKSQSSSQPLDPDKSLSPPTKLTASQVSNSKAIRLNWEKSVSNNVSHYRIFRIDVNGSGLDKKIGEVANSETSFTDEGTQEGKTYSYFIRAVRSEKESMNTELVQIQVMAISKQSQKSPMALEKSNKRLSRLIIVVGSITILAIFALVILLVKHRKLHHKHKALLSSHSDQKK